MSNDTSHCTSCGIGVCPAKQRPEDKQPRYCRKHMTKAETHKQVQLLEKLRWKNYRRDNGNDE